MLAAVGPNADAFAPPAATEFAWVGKFCPPCSLFFLQRILTALSMDFEMAYTAPPGVCLAFYLAFSAPDSCRRPAYEWRRDGASGFARIRVR